VSSDISYFWHFFLLTMESCNIASLCSRLASSEHPSTASVMGIAVPVGVYALIILQQAARAVSYLSIIIAIFKKGQYIGMPASALFLNFGWEVSFGLVWIEKLGWEAAGHRLWMLLNGIILYQFIQLQLDSPSKLVYQGLHCITLWAVLAAFVVEFKDFAGVYSDFLVQLITAIVMVHNVWETPSDLFGSVFPGYLRLFSCLCGSIAFLSIVEHSVLLTTTHVAILGWNIIYVAVDTSRYMASSSDESGVKPKVA
jgi:hypothetical protein